MIILQFVLWLFGSIVAGRLLSIADCGQPRVSARTLTLLCLAFIPSSGLAWVGWGKLTDLNTHFVIGDSASTPLRDGYTMISADGAFGVLVGGPVSEHLVVGIESIAETGTSYFGFVEARQGDPRRAFAVHKKYGTVRFASSLRALGVESFDPSELDPYHEFPGRSPTIYDDLVLALLSLGPFAVVWHWLRSRSPGADASQGSRGYVEP